MDELERKTDCDDPKHRDVVYCIQCTDRDIAALEAKLREKELQVDEYRRFCEEIIDSSETDLTFWKRRAQFSLDAMKKREGQS
jgi:hypothetical protein